MTLTKLTSFTSKARVKRVAWVVVLLAALAGVTVMTAWASQLNADRASIVSGNLQVVPTVPGIPVRINEILPRPGSDWNGDGVADLGDEYIELHNSDSGSFPIGGWILNASPLPAELDAEAVAPDAYTIPEGTMLPPSGVLVFYRKMTGLALRDNGGIVDLLLPGGESYIDQFIYDSVGIDRSWSRVIDGSGGWTISCAPSPGQLNRNYPLCCPDFNGNGSVDLPDIITIAQRWNTASSDPIYDRDGDGWVTVVDVMLVLGRAGDSCSN